MSSAAEILGAGTSGVGLGIAVSRWGSSAPRLQSERGSSSSAAAAVPDVADVERAGAGVTARERRERMRRFADPAAEHRAVHSSASVNRASRRGG